ncbi:MAG: PD-(D/E)XK nuclease family transposase [Methylococcales bacterium]|nr:PD-(D/E)XK nuclease family transposase [Methylococcales bacterium]MCK5925926.1 PD-(D/E)XK nuclease family transposase [Methylococcales bacterium]
MNVIPLKYGTVFKRAFSQPDVFCQFANDVLDIELNIDEVHTEYEYPKPIGFVRSKYDLFAEDEEQRIIVEIQHVKEDDFFDRFLYYHLISMVEQVGGFKEYGFDRTVYTIVVLTSTPRDNSVNFSCAVSNMNPIDEHQRIVDVYPHRLVFLCPRQANEKTPPKIKKWLDFIEDSLDGKMEDSDYSDDIWQKIIEAIQEKTIDPDTLSEIKDEMAWSNAKNRFIDEGRKEGLEKGLEKGRKEGAENLQKERQKIIEKAQKMGLDDDAIAQLIK